MPPRQVAQHAALRRFGQRLFDRAPRPAEFATHVEVDIVGLEHFGGDGQSFDDQLRPQQHDLAVLEGAGLAFVGVEHDVALGLRL